MTDPLNLLLLIITLIGLAGTLIPSLPGTGIILFGAGLHALLSGFTPITGLYLTTMILIFVAGYLGQYLITAVTSRKMGGSGSGVIGACLGMVAGFILPIPGGIFAGAFIGAVSFEILFDLKDLRAATKSGIGALTGVLLSLFFEFGVGLIMAAMLVLRIFSSGP